MKRTWKTAIALMLIASVLMLTSCDGLFTRSVMKNAARDPDAAAKALAEKPTSTLVDDAGAVADKTQAQSVVGALSAQAKDDPSKITSLDDGEKKKIVDAAMTAVIDLTAIASEVDLNALMSEDSNVDEDELMNNLVGSIIDNLGACDTTCVKVILDDSVTTDANGDPVLSSNVSEEMKGTLALGAITVACSAVQGSGFELDDLMDAMDGTDASGTDAQVSALLGPDASPDDVASLTSALNTLAALEAAGYEFGDAFGMGE